VNDGVPAGARAVARVLVLDSEDRLLLLKAVHAADGYTFWTAPGGGLDPGEGFAEAAHRELREETGLDLAPGRWVWTRRHIFTWNGRPADQYERFFIARTSDTAVQPVKQDSHVVAHRWWTLPELLRSPDAFAPARLPELIADVIRGSCPDPPIDCGI
jgi:8-oxo-dGTP pyrophosphatase MutT (NUDIX family)